MTLANWDYSRLGAAAGQSASTEAPRFDAGQVAGIVAKRQSQGRLGEGELFAFEVLFKPNQDRFAPELYADSFKRVVNLAATYGGAVITVEGHSDPLGYLRAKQEGSAPVVLARTQQSAKNLSVSRAISVRDSVIAYAKTQGISLDPSQFAVVGHGIEQPRTGICGLIRRPKTEPEWLSNMRVEFRVIQIEAEALRSNLWGRNENVATCSVAKCVADIALLRCERSSPPAPRTRQRWSQERKRATDCRVGRSPTHRLSSCLERIRTAGDEATTCCV
jgi:outer membrane protein OmpA-like peptidoglycan-associated protein